PIGSAVGDVGDVAGWLLAGFELRPGHGDVVGAGGWFGLEAAAGAVVEVAADDMEDSGYRYGEQGAQEPEQLDPDEDADQHGQRGQLHRARHDDRLQDVVLQLLVNDEDDQDHDGGGQRVQGGHGDGHDGPQGRTDQGEQVGEDNKKGADPA